MSKNLTLALLPFALLFAACSSGGGSGGGSGGAETSSGRVGTEVPKPDGSGTFFVDENRSGKTSRLELVELMWGRLVDVHGLDSAGRVDPVPVFRDWLISEAVQTNGVDYVLQENPITQRTQLVVLRERATTPDEFRRLLERASTGLAPVAARSDEPTASGPFSLVARNACIALRFSDVLDDSSQARGDLTDTIRVLTGYRPGNPFQARIVFDPNHGALVAGEFHTTRVLVDLTVSRAESVEGGALLSLNSIGLPASNRARSEPNVSIRIATKEHAASGRFRILQGFSGASLAASINQPVDAASETEDVVRAFRSGNDTDGNSGFLLDLNAPEVLGSWPITVEDVRPDPVEAGFRFLLDLRFDSLCQEPLDAGDVLSVGEYFLEVVEPTPPPVDSRLETVRLRLQAARPLERPASLLGSGSLERAYDPSSSVPTGCWITFAPMPGAPPTTAVSPRSQVIVRFSEPVDPRSVTPFETLLVLRGAAAGRIEAESVVVGTIDGSEDAQTFANTPLLPLQHGAGSADLYNVRIGRVTDLAGNELANVPPPIAFSIDPDAEAEANAGVALRFSGLDEVKPVHPDVGVDDDLRGQIFYDFERGVIRPRLVTFSSFPADRTNPVPSIMTPFPLGVQTPLTPFGSRMMTVWRYVDFGWNAADETKFNLDVAGLSWAPLGGIVNSDFYEEFEIRLAHSRYQPDEDLDANKLPKHRNSGLRPPPSRFDDNILRDVNSPQAVVHDRSLGYVIDPSELFVTPTGTPMIPFPLNRGGGSLKTFNWRDTSVLARGGPSGVGVPLDIEAGAPLNLVPGGAQGSIAGAGSVPAAYLPLLMDFRCYPTSSGIGLNSLDISLAVNSSAQPNFRAFSSGGTDSQGRQVFRNPDLADVPEGGFNPRTRPPGQPTALAADNTFHVGQLDVVTRVSRANSVWMDTLYREAAFRDPILIPSSTDQPPGTSVRVDFRGATGFAPNADGREFDAASIDAYGDVRDDAITPPGRVWVDYVGGSRWKSSISEIDGARYFQLRITFLNDVESGESPELSAIGVAFVED